MPSGCACPVQAQPATHWLEVMPPYLDDIRLFHVRPDGQSTNGAAATACRSLPRKNPTAATCSNSISSLVNMKFSSACKPPAP